MYKINIWNLKEVNKECGGVGGERLMWAKDRYCHINFVE